MVLFSRAFVRKRMISLATTASVAATSFALAQDPSRAFHVRGAMPIQLALTHDRGGEGPLEPLAAFMTNAAGSAIVNATGAIRQVVHGEDKLQRRYLVIAEGRADMPGSNRTDTVEIANADPGAIPAES